MPGNRLSSEQQRTVRDEVARLLSRTAAFRELPAAQRRDIARGMVDVVSYLADPKAGQSVDEAAPNAELLELVEGQARPIQPHRPEADADKKTAGDLLNPAANKQAGETFRTLTSAVDFPEFVGSLVEGVFDSIVNSSIKQMEAYSKMLEAVVMSLNDFKDDNVSEADARQHVLDKFPDFFDIEDDGNKLKLASGADEDAMPDLQGAFGFEGELDLDEPEVERKLVESVRLKMARMRQQQLATMVLLGINRIIVTDGKINAKVRIDVKAVDSVKRKNRRGERMLDIQRQQNRRVGIGWGSARASRRVQTTVQSAFAESKDESESTIKSRAQLTGSVSINFKSETFPLEKIGSPAELFAVNEKSGRNQAQAAAEPNPRGETS